MIYLDLGVPAEPVPNFVVGDAHHLPFRGEAFKAIYMMHVLEHLERPGLALAEAARVLKPGGRLLIEVPGPLSSVFRLDPSHRWRLTPGRLRRLLASFRETRIWGEGLSSRLVPFWPLRLLLGRLLPRVPWPLAEYLVAEAIK